MFSFEVWPAVLNWFFGGCFVIIFLSLTKGLWERALRSNQLLRNPGDFGRPLKWLFHYYEGSGPQWGWFPLFLERSWGCFLGCKFTRESSSSTGPLRSFQSQQRWRAPCRESQGPVQPSNRTMGVAARSCLMSGQTTEGGLRIRGCAAVVADVRPSFWSCLSVFTVMNCEKQSG